MQCLVQGHNSVITDLDASKVNALKNDNKENMR